MLSDKYIAGLIDSDGSIGLMYNKTATEGIFNARASLRFTEAPSKSNLLSKVQEAIGGNINMQDRVSNFGPNLMRYLVFTGTGAVSTIKRIQQYLVVKHGLAEYACSVNGTRVMKEEVAKKVKEIRATGQRYPNFLSRKWFAAYVDGNGCFTGGLRPSGKYQPRINVAAWNRDVGVLELMKKQYGGGVHAGGGQTAYWGLSLEDPSKCIELLEYLEHVIAIKPQRDFLLSLARSGGFQDGKTIRDQLKTLNSRVAETKSSDTGNSEVIVH
jgi:hypothetical protein